MSNKYDGRNTLTVGVVAGLLGGFILAMILQVFDIGELKDVPAWLQGISGLIATLVSIYAVYLVSQTLEATRMTLEQANDTLKITQKMAVDQKAIGYVQSRAYVYLDDYEIYAGEDTVYLWVYFKNYGNSPALELDFHLRFCLAEFVIKEDGSTAAEETKREFAASFYEKALMAGERTKIKTLKFKHPLSVPDSNLFLRIKFSYQTLPDKNTENDADVICVKKFGEYWPPITE